MAADEEAQRKADEEAFAAAMGDDAGDLLEVPEEAPVKKSSSKDKKKGSDKLSKTDSKDSKSSSKKSKKEEPAPFVVDEEPAPEPVPEPEPLEDERDAPKADGWGFWGASLKSSKKAAPPPAKTLGNGVPSFLRTRVCVSMTNPPCEWNRAPLIFAAR